MEFDASVWLFVWYHPINFIYFLIVYIIFWIGCVSSFRGKGGIARIIYFIGDTNLGGISVRGIFLGIIWGFWDFSFPELGIFLGFFWDFGIFLES